MNIRNGIEPWFWALHDAVRHYCIPLALWPRIPTTAPSREIIGGTSFLLRLGGPPFLVTAAHVVTELAKGLQPDRELRIHDRTLSLTGDRVQCNQKRDLALVGLTEDEVSYLQRSGFWVVSPIGWPPPAPREGELVVFGGFQGILRELRSASTVEFGFSSFGATINRTRDGGFACRLDKESYRKIRVASGIPAPLFPDNLAGLSGGPTFVVPDHTNVETLTVQHIGGLVSQGSLLWEDSIDFTFAGLDGIRADGTIMGC